MKIYYLVVLFVLFSPTMTDRHKKIKTIKMTTKQKCEKIKCPPIDDPVCVKMTNKHKEVYIIAINKCEMKYASCHKDVNATIVPMVNCLHDEKKHQNITSKRNKRDVQESAGDTNTFKIAYLSGHKGHKLKLNYQEEDDENDSPKLLKGQSDDTDDDTDSADNKLLKDETGNETEGDPLLQDESGNEIEGDHLLKGESGAKDGVSADKLYAFTDEEQNRSGLDGNNSEDSNKPNKTLNDVEDDAKVDIDNNDIVNMIAADYINADYDLLKNQEVDLNENNKNCPTVCPSRDVMVCAKCKHNIHRTFLSTCHLRMFACKHSKEKLELVKREPCIQSAPFISDFNDTKGRIPESGEMDEVHKFIFCRNKKLQNKADPRCKV